MLGNQYREEFLNQAKSKAINTTLINQICNAEEKLNKDIMEWTQGDLFDYVISRNESSGGHVAVLIYNFNELRDFINQQEGTSTDRIRYESVDELVSYDNLTFITFEQYQKILMQMKDANTRDRLLLELFWLCLTSERIRNLKETDIEFKIDKDEHEYILLNFSDKKPLRCDDIDVINDIKKAMNEKYYFIEAKDGRSKKLVYANSPYIIKVPNIGKAGQNKAMIGYPSLSLLKAFIAQGVACDDIDMQHLFGLHIRRSSLIYKLSPQFKDFYDINTIMEIYGFKSDVNLYRFRKIAEEKYPLKKKDEVNND